VLAGRSRRALDSTILDDAVATQDTVTQLIAATRGVAREVPGAAKLIAAECTGYDYARPGKPSIDWDDAAVREAVVSVLVSDALHVLAAFNEATLDATSGAAVALLALVAGQDVEPAEGSDGTDGRWRIARKVAPDRVISVVDSTPGMRTRLAPTVRTDSRRTWQSNPRPGSSPPGGSPKPAAGHERRGTGR
jgi:hypothetical protein